jgi:predicted amidophosphoribosyltransferase
VPSSKPLVEAALTRAGHEGWWVPSLALELVRAHEGVVRQRERKGKERMVVADKWEIAAEKMQSAPPILLLDDIYTTGGSLHSLAAELKRAGARTVKAVAWGAQTQPRTRIPLICRDDRISEPHARRGRCF